MKIVINRSNGYFKPSDEAIKQYLKCKGINYFLYYYYGGRYYREDYVSQKIFELPFLGRIFLSEDCGGILDKDDPSDKDSIVKNKINEYTIPRIDKDFVRIVEKLGNKASATNSNLVVIDIPNDLIAWRIVENDGYEVVEELHRYWPGGENISSNYSWNQMI